MSQEILEKYECLNDPNKRVYLVFADINNVTIHYTDVNGGMMQKNLNINKITLQIDNVSGRILNWKELIL